MLLVEDNCELAGSIRSALQKSGDTVDWLSDGASAEAFICSEELDLVILDLTLPEKDGLAILHSIRADGNMTPVLVLSARSDLKERVRSLDLGADDFLAKPFELEELEARTRALVRRHRQKADSQMKAGQLTFDMISRRVYIGEKEVFLTAKEISVLEVLLSRRGSVMNKDQIAAQIYNLDENISRTAIEIFVHRIRKKTENAGFTIRTIRGLGYLLEDQ